MLNVIGVLCVGLGALTHMGTAVIAVPVGVELALLSAIRAAPDRESRQRRLVPLGAVLPPPSPLSGSSSFSPAGRSWRAIPRASATAVRTGWWQRSRPTGRQSRWLFVGTAGIGLGTFGEVRRRRPGSWVMLAAWMATNLGVVLASVVEGASTDYPRFATPLLAPLVLEGAGAGGSWRNGSGSSGGRDRDADSTGAAYAGQPGQSGCWHWRSSGLHPGERGPLHRPARGGLWALSDPVGLDRVAAAWVEATPAGPGAAPSWRLCARRSGSRA